MIYPSSVIPYRFTAITALFNSYICFILLFPSCCKHLTFCILSMAEVCQECAHLNFPYPYGRHFMSKAVAELMVRISYYHSPYHSFSKTAAEVTVRLKNHTINSAKLLLN